MAPNSPSTGIPLNPWRVQAAYTHLRMDLKLDADSSDPGFQGTEKENPRHQLFGRSSLDLPGNMELDLSLRHVGKLAGLNVGDYASLDARLGWKPHEKVEFYAVGQNLLESRHLEFSKTAIINTRSSAVERGVYGGMTWKL